MITIKVLLSVREIKVLINGLLTSWEEIAKIEYEKTSGLAFILRIEGEFTETIETLIREDVEEFQKDCQYEE